MDKTNLPKEERKVEYLLLHLGVPMKQQHPSRKHIIEANKAAKELGINVRRIKVGTSSGGDDRYIFRFPWYRREDAVANHIAESLLFAVNVTFGPIGDDNESANILPIPSLVVKGIDAISLRDLIELEEERFFDLKTVAYPMSIGSAIHIADIYVTSAWKITHLLYTNSHLFDAARFLKESQDNFYVWPGQYDDVLYDSSSEFRTGWERARLEVGLLNAFKVVEALIGDPPSDDNKLIRKIQSIGINPHDEFGIDPRVPLYQYIRKMNIARDKASAHGRTHHQIILVRDMFLYQDCSRFMLKKTIENILGEPLYAS